MKKTDRVKKHSSIRKHLSGTTERPRVAVFRSSAHIYAQLIDDTKHQTLAAESDMKIKGTKIEKASQVGQALAKRAIQKKVKKIVFDRGGFKFHGRIKALAEGLRSGGLEF